MLVLVVALVFGIASVSMANELACEKPCLPKDKSITITATNPLQGEIDLQRSKHLGVFPCGDNKNLEGDIPVKIRSNGYLKVTMDLQQGFEQGKFELPTHADLIEHVDSRPSNRSRITVHQDWERQNKLSGSYTMNATDGSGRGNKIRNYTLNVKTKTGLIEAQPEGKYTAKIKITIAAP